MDTGRNVAVALAGAAATTLLAVGMAAAPAHAQVPEPIDCSVEYEILSGGDDGFMANVIVTNDEPSVPPYAGKTAYWQVTLFYGGGGPELYHMSSGEFQEIGSLVLIRSDRGPLAPENTHIAWLGGHGLSQPLTTAVTCQDQPFDY